MLQSTPPAPADLIAAVNALRANQGLPALISDPALMSIAQAHSEYMSANHLITHAGPGGTRPVDRAMAAGYGGGATVFISENIAMTQLATSLDTVIHTIWADATHWNTMVNPQYVHVGAGISEHNGQVFYTLDVGYIAGGSTVYTPLPTTGVGTPQAPAPTVQNVVPVETSSVGDDGSIIHEVRAGQALWTIAEAYKIPVEQLAALNNLDVKNPMIYEKQKLLIRPPFTPTVTATITLTPRAPTRTPRPTFTPHPTRASATPTQSPTSTPPPLIPPETFSRRNFGFTLVLISGLGLAFMGAGYLLRKRKGK